MDSLQRARESKSEYDARGGERSLSVRYGRVVKHESENLYALSKGN